MSVTTPILRVDVAAADASTEGAAADASTDGAAADASTDGAATDGATVAPPELQAATRMDNPAARVSPRERVRMFPPTVRGSRVHDGLLPRDRNERRAAAPVGPPMCRIVASPSRNGKGL